MNKVFKVIWSEARNAYVVVSEMAKSHGTKSCSTKKLLAMLIATGVMTCASVAPVMAANLAPDDLKVEIGKDASATITKYNIDNGIAVGASAKAEEEDAIAIGSHSNASGLDSVAIGGSAKALASDTIAIGGDANATEYGSVAIGNDIHYTGQSATAVGQQAHATGKVSTAIGTMTNVDADWNVAHPGQWRQAGDQSTAIGAYAGSWGVASTAVGGFSKAEGEQATAVGYKSQANADNSIAVGGFSKAEGEFATALGYAGNANGYCSTALGDYAQANVSYGVALGGSSIADREAGMIGAFAPEGADSLTWIANGGAVSVGANNSLTRQIINVAAGTADTDAVNVAQLKRAMENVNIKFEAGNGIVIETVKGDDGTTYKISTNIVGSDTKTDTTTVTPSASGDGGTIGGDTGIIVPNPGINPLPNQPETDNNIQTGDPVKIETVTKPTNFTADDGNTLAISPSETLGIKGDSNITTKTDADGKNIQVTLNPDLDVKSVNAETFTAGDTTINNNGLTINNGPSVTNNGIDAGGKKITNVEAGELSETSKDAVNGSQLHETNINVANNSMRINKLGDRVNKVGAGAAALAALHPMDFDPDDKWSFAAGYGNYAGENAAAIGAYYRPDEKVMFSVGGTVGNGENMVNAGISFALDRTNHVSNSRTALAREVIDLRGQLAEMGAKMAKMEKAFGMLDETKTKLFPDIPANHWAYEYIAKLAGNGYIEGYPDGNFGGDRLMTRYEFAAMLYRAIENGAALEEKIIKEFEPELGRIRVDRISGEDGDRDKIERVRVNDTKGERDHYGNKLTK